METQPRTRKELIARAVHQPSEEDRARYERHQAHAMNRFQEWLEQLVCDRERSELEEHVRWTTEEEGDG